MSIVLASANLKKLRELQAGLAGLPEEIISPSNLVLPEETGLTFVENAILKARAASEQTGLPAIADDSGLAVDALRGQPGIYSARFAGAGATDTENLAKLLKTLEAVENRSAAYICVLVYFRYPNDPLPLIAQGRWQGELLRAPRGDQGFGYDPIFYLPELQKTAAELSLAEKSRVSHRAQAILRLKAEMLAC